MTQRSHFSTHALAATACIMLFSACTEKPLPIQLEKYCVSESGLSKYWIKLRTSENSGEIRYSYMGQDVQYKVVAMKIDGGEISGQANFLSSSTGEIRGNPMLFSYDGTAEVLKDGGISAACQNMQDNV